MVRQILLIINPEEMRLIFKRFECKFRLHLTSASVDVSNGKQRAIALLRKGASTWIFQPWTVLQCVVRESEKRGCQPNYLGFLFLFDFFVLLFALQCYFRLLTRCGCCCKRLRCPTPPRHANAPSLFAAHFHRCCHNFGIFFNA